MQLCGCVSFLVVAGNSSQNENTLLQKNLIGVLFYDPLADVCFFIRPNTLLLCIVLFCIFLLYRTDPQVDVQIRILLKDKYEIVSIMGTPAIPLWFLKKWLFGFFILEKQLASQNIFLVKSELSITMYLFLVFYKSTSL
jgi:hypothetical protein